MYNALNGELGIGWSEPIKTIIFRSTLNRNLCAIFEREKEECQLGTLGIILTVARIGNIPFKWTIRNKKLIILVDFKGVVFNTRITDTDPQGISWSRWVLFYLDDGDYMYKGAELIGHPSPWAGAKMFQQPYCGEKKRSSFYRLSEIRTN